MVSFNITECNRTDCVSGVHFQSAKVYLRIALLSLQSAKAWWIKPISPKEKLPAVLCDHAVYSTSFFWRRIVAVILWCHDILCILLAHQSLLNPAVKCLLTRVNWLKSKAGDLVSRRLPSGSGGGSGNPSRIIWPMCIYIGWQWLFSIHICASWFAPPSCG